MTTVLAPSAVVLVPLLENPLEDGEVRVDHPCRAESTDGVGAAVGAIDKMEPRDGGNRLVGVGHEPARDAVPDDLRHRPETCRDDRRSSGERLHDGEAEGLGEADQMEQGARAAEKRISLHWTHGSHIGHPSSIDVRSHDVAEVRLVLDDACDHERQPRPLGNLHGKVCALVGVDPSEEQQVVVGDWDEAEPVEVDAVMDGGRVVQGRV